MYFWTEYANEIHLKKGLVRAHYTTNVVSISDLISYKLREGAPFV